MPSEKLLDVSALEAPLPLQYSVKAASILKDSEYIRMIHRMKPCHLFSFLEKMDKWWIDFFVSDAEYVVIIANKNDIDTVEYIKGSLLNEYDGIVTRASTSF